jgi:hypothetical protein
MRFPRTLLPLVAATLVATACSGDSNAPDNSHVGSYALVSVDNEPLPITLYDDGSVMVALTEGTLALNANNSFTQGITLNGSIDGEAGPPEHLSCSGTYTHSGNSFTLTSVESEGCSGATLTGTRDGNTLTFVDDTGERLIFSR